MTFLHNFSIICVVAIGFSVLSGARTSLDCENGKNVYLIKTVVDKVLVRFWTIKCMGKKYI